MTKTIDLEIKNDLSEIDILASKILDFCTANGIRDEFSYDIRLALEEAISNTIKYGYQDHQVHSILIRAALNSNGLFLEIEDDAAEFNPIQVPMVDVSVPIEQKTPGGLGIYLLRTVMDKVEYERRGSKNILRMTKIQT